MALLELENVSLRIPVITRTSRSLKAALLKPISKRRLDTTSGRTYVNALNNVSFKLEEGTRLGLKGPNGAGKSTLLRVLAGVYTPSSGHITREGNIRTLIDMQAGMTPTATGRENVSLRSAYLGFSKQTINNIIEDVREFTQLGDFFDLPVFTYSSGMAARLSFAINTAVPPEILLIDEGIGVGDAAFQKAAQARIDAFKRKAKILVLATHSEVLMKQFCTHCININNGVADSIQTIA